MKTLRRGAWPRGDGVQFLMSHTVTTLREAGGQIEQIDHVKASDAEGRFQRVRGDATCWR